MQRQIRLDKFEQVLPRAMRDNGIDMWIVAVKENHYDPLWNDLGRGYVSGIGYYVFTDRGGDRIERAALGPSGYMLSESGAYDIVAAASTLADHVKARSPRRIGLNMSEQIGWPDGLSVTMLAHLKSTLGDTFVSRFVSAEKLVADFRLHRVAAEIRRVRRGRQHRDPADRAGIVERSDHARQDDARGRRVVDAGSAARLRPRLRVRYSRSTACGRTTSATPSPPRSGTGGATSWWTPGCPEPAGRVLPGRDLGLEGRDPLLEGGLLQRPDLRLAAPGRPPRRGRRSARHRRWWP